ncbi:MAG: addiction module protein [Epsilonproteobacteria bacterium]|nr:addiction module protein [Campylobacterota bacterium]
MLAINQEQLFKNIEILPIEIKTKIVDMLLKSLNPINESIDNLWLKEVNQRKEDIESGRVETIDGDEVFLKIQKRLDK